MPSTGGACTDGGIIRWILWLLMQVDADAGNGIGARATTGASGPGRWYRCPIGGIGVALFVLG
ncbi:MAG: hypothetical protein N2Z82_11910 [Thermomicrobium sp.]|nr:hypothetical protein [Thermomicrobium sp.]